MPAASPTPATPRALPLIEFRVLDHNAVALGVDLGELMENAGRAVAEALRARWPGARRVVIACGPGNNGGDGLVAARLLREAGLTVEVVLAAAPRSRLALRNHARWEGPTHGAAALPGLLAGGGAGGDGAGGDGAGDGGMAGTVTVAVDALLGSGLRGPLREPHAALARALNDHAAVLAVDVPTGLGLAGAVRPAATVTFHARKEGMDRETCGEITVVDIGFPAAAACSTGPGEVELLPRLPADARKGDGGVVVIVGGGPYTGAPALAALGAYRLGADLVYLLVPQAAAAVVAGFAPEFMVTPLPGDHLVPEHLETIMGFADRADALLVGPGLGRQAETRAAVAELLARWERPRVVDADGLFALALALALAPKTARGALLTPHRGELARLAQAAGVAADAPALAARLGCTLLAKGPIDIITDGAQQRENRTGHPRLRVGGTGDVLAGAAAAALARGLTPFQAARVAAYLVGRAGELAAERGGDGFLATEVAAQIPAALAEARPA